MRKRPSLNDTTHHAYISLLPITARQGVNHLIHRPITRSNYFFVIPLALRSAFSCYKEYM